MAPEVARKQEKDYSSEVDALVPAATQMAEVRLSSTVVERGRPARARGLLAEPLTVASLDGLQSGRLQDGIDKLLALEKLTRNVSVLCRGGGRKARRQLAHHHLSFARPPSPSFAL